MSKEEKKEPIIIKFEIYPEVKDITYIDLWHKNTHAKYLSQTAVVEYMLPTLSLILEKSVSLEGNKFIFEIDKEEKE